MRPTWEMVDSTCSSGSPEGCPRSMDAPTRFQAAVVRVSAAEVLRALRPLVGLLVWLDHAAVHGNSAIRRWPQWRRLFIC